MLSAADRDRLEHILDAIDKIERVVDGVRIDQFRDDWQKRLLVERLLEIIGEAANHVSIDCQDLHSHVPWVTMTNMRNFISHEYFRIDVGIVWDTATESIPDLRPEIEEILSGE